MLQSSSSSMQVAGAVGQRQWIQAFLPFAARVEYSASVIAVAMALLELHFNRKTGQCDPGEDVLAADIGRDIRTIRRVMKVLKADGWLRLQRRGDGNAQIIFTIPDRTAVVLSVPRYDRTQTAYRQDTNGVPIGHHAVLSNEHRTQNTEARLTARAPVFVDRVRQTAPPLAPAMAAAAAPLPTTEEEREARAKFIEGLKAKYGPHWGIKQDTTRIR